MFPVQACTLRADLSACVACAQLESECTAARELAAEEKQLWDFLSMQEQDAEAEARDKFEMVS